MRALEHDGFEDDISVCGVFLATVLAVVGYGLTVCERSIVSGKTTILMKK